MLSSTVFYGVSKEVFLKRILKSFKCFYAMNKTVTLTPPLFLIERLYVVLLV